jgi:ketosteroid isomerase-like protein
MWETVAQQMGLKDVRLQTLDFEQAGDTGYEVGEVTLALAGGTVVVKVVVAWKKTDGQWRLQRDIWNTKGP